MLVPQDCIPSHAQCCPIVGTATFCLSVPQRAGVWLFPGWGCSESSCHEPRVRVSDSPSARGGSWGWTHWPRGDRPPAVSAPPRPCQRSSCLSSTSLPRGRGCLPAFSCVSLVASGEGTAGTPCARRPFPRLFSQLCREAAPACACACACGAQWSQHVTLLICSHGKTNTA